MLVKIIVIGYIGLKKTRTFNDYFLGGRTVGPWMSAFTYAAAYFSAVLFIGFAGKVGWGFGLSYLFKANFGLAYGTALVFMGLFTAFYLVLGGYKSMTMIDVVFGVIMCLGSAVLLASTLQKAGGLGNLTSGLAAIDPRLTAAVGPAGAWPLFALVFLTSVAPFAMPQLVQKFYAIKDERAIRRGMIASTAFAALIAGTAYFTGAAARLFLTPESAPGAFAAGKPVFDVLMPEFLAKVIPPSLSIVMMLLILSASMSTLAALVLISSSSVVKDLYAGFVNPDVPDRTLTRMMRVTSAVFILLSVVLAYLRPATIVAILSVSWGGDRLVLPRAVRLGPYQQKGDEIRCFGLGDPRPRDMPGPRHRRDGAGGSGNDRDDRFARRQSAGKSLWLVAVSSGRSFRTAASCSC